MGNGIKPTIYSHFTLGDMAAYYMLEKEDNQIELLFPNSKRKRINRKTGRNARQQMLTWR